MLGNCCGFRKSGELLEGAPNMEKVDELIRIMIAEDNQGCMKATYNPVCTDLSRHVDVKY